MSNPWIRRRGHRDMPVPASNRSAQEMRIQRRDKKSFTERNEMDFFTSLYKNENEILKRVSKFERNPAPINTYEVNSDIYSTSIISRQPIAQLYYDESVYQLDVNKKKPKVTTQTLKKKKKENTFL